MGTIRYDAQMRESFDERTAVVLDALNRRYGIVEFEPPTCPDEPNACWFVQVYEATEAQLPTGIYGDTLYQAAKRLAKALGVDLETP